MLGWFWSLLKEIRISRRRKRMFPFGPEWRRIAPGMYAYRINKIRRYSAMRRTRESKRYFREVLGLSEDQINKMFRERAAW